MTTTRTARGAKAKTARKAPAKRSSTPKATTPTRKPSKKTTATRKKVADKAVAAAKAQGATGAGSHGRLTRQQRTLRNTAIIARVQEGQTREGIAKEFGISKRAVEDVVANWREPKSSSLDQAPMQIVEWLARMHLRQMADLEGMAVANAERNPSVALGAKKAAGDALLRYTELMSAVGKLPDNLELFRAESVLRRLADEMMEAMERVEAGDMTPGEAGELFRSIVSQGEQRELPETTG